MDTRPPGLLLPGLLALFILGCGDDSESPVTAPEPEAEPVREPAALSCVAPPDGLVSWWPGEDTPDDIVGESAGTEIGAATYEAGYVGQAFKLSGSGAAVVLDQAARAGRFTIEAWIRPENSATAGRRALYGSFLSGFYLTGGRLTWWQTENAAGGPGIGVTCVGEQTCDRFVGLERLEPGRWQHVALAYDGTEFRGYIDGRLDHAVAFSGGLLTGTGATPGIGMWARDDFPFWFAGLIDEPAIYTKALTATEIEAIWDAGSMGKCRP